MVPPVSGTYQDDIDTWIAEFKELYPHLDVEVIKTSWDDHNGKLSTMANAGEAPTSLRSPTPPSAPTSSWASPLTLRSTWTLSVWPTTIRTRSTT